LDLARAIEENPGARNFSDCLKMGRALRWYLSLLEINLCDREVRRGFYMELWFYFGDRKFSF
jgi:hypothetical protein